MASEPAFSRDELNDQADFPAEASDTRVARRPRALQLAWEVSLNTLPKPHKPTCARRIRLREEVAGRTPHQIAVLVYEHCGVTKLRAHRLARGKTLAQAGLELRQLAEQGDPQGPRAEGDQLGSWETGGRTPRLATVDLLCRYYECTPFDLGLGASGGPSGERVVVASQSAVVSRQESGRVVPPSLGDRVDAARRSADRTLARGSVAGGQLDLLEERLLLIRREYLYTPPAEMLAQLLLELAEVEGHSTERQTTSVQIRLTEMTAVLATLIADSLMKLGDDRRSRGWYETARHAAEESGNLELRARVRAQAAMLPYYYGPLDAAVTLAREARLMTRQRPSATAAFAAAAEARALAQQGNASEAEARIREARTMYDRMPPCPDDDAFGFPWRRFLLYLSGTYTALGQGSRARKVQEEALALYPARTGIDPALLRLEAAICLAHERSGTEACQLATATYLQVPEDHRTPIISARARRVIEELPGVNGRTRAAMELRELLELPRGPM
ncbi:XRE family transcriptional regulator [Streptomyces sp. NPDC005283]|uniref:XRE family transcriptional regulator n=1 Tax=Streptomyces sp. NPDC005283 TaxID=3156871 RepID=UPI0034571B18